MMHSVIAIFFQVAYSDGDRYSGIGSQEIQQVQRTIINEMNGQKRNQLMLRNVAGARRETK